MRLKKRRDSPGTTTYILSQHVGGRIAYQSARMHGDVPRPVIASELRRMRSVVMALVAAGYDSGQHHQGMWP